MKIAIMTQPLGKNYGGIMQAWALQQVLKKAGHEPVTLDRQADSRSIVYRAARHGKIALKKALGKRKGPISFNRHIPLIQEYTQAFIRKHICMSESISSTEGLRKHFDREKYDAVIVGSDQTWRPRYSPNIYNFFLDFLEGSEIKRVAYATSFGVDEWEFSSAQTELCAKLAGQFDAISVREKSGVDLCHNYLRVSSDHVLDPTLLLERNTYESLIEREEVKAGGGVYTYVLDQAEWKENVIETVSERLNKARFANQPRSSMDQPGSSELSDYVMPSVEGWIKGFFDADFVITDSFHGTVFSIIFNKPFVSLINSSRGASRFYSLAGELGLENRLLNTYSEDAVALLLDSPIDYSDVNRRLCSLRDKSIKILLDALGR